MKGRRGGVCCPEHPAHQQPSPRHSPNAPATRNPASSLASRWRGDCAPKHGQNLTIRRRESINAANQCKMLPMPALVQVRCVNPMAGGCPWKRNHARNRPFPLGNNSRTESCESVCEIIELFFGAPKISTAYRRACYRTRNTKTTDQRHQSGDPPKPGDSARPDLSRVELLFYKTLMIEFLVRQIKAPVFGPGGPACLLAGAAFGTGSGIGRNGCAAMGACFRGGHDLRSGQGLQPIPAYSSSVFKSNPIST